jgi:carbamate kinase
LPRIVVALGGNALIRRRETASIETQRRRLAATATILATLAQSHALIVTHGNGPQIGLLAMRDAADPIGPAAPLDVLGAESEGQIGYLIEQALRAALPGREIATLLTEVVVDPGDPAFLHPSKPVGPLYDTAEAGRIGAARGWTFGKDGTGFRRLVPSPEPRRILEIGTIRLLVDAGVIVICAGGGGIPVTIDEPGMIRGIEAVIDKDLSAALLAAEIGADRLLLLTDVGGVLLGHGGPAPELLRTATPTALREMTFAAGSMGPKVEAACRFVERTGGIAAIGALDRCTDLLAGRAGTQVRPDPP